MTGYLALYRKHRSKSLDDIVGQEHITQTIKNALEQDKISHAYLFTGPRGVGKTSVARILAHAVNGLSYDPLKNPPVDIVEIDAASNRRIDEIRDLREKIHISPTSSKYKVYIVDEVHMLTREAFNALLKTLEEPPSHVIFILATTESHKLPSTIISRTQQYSFKPLLTNTIIEHLANIAKIEKINIDKQALNLIAEHGKGSFRDSISMLDQIRSISKSAEVISVDAVEKALGLAPLQTINNLLEAVFNQQSSDVTEQLHTLVGHGITPQQIALQCMDFLQHSIKQENGQIINVGTRLSLLDDLMNVAVSSFPDLKLQTVLLKANLSTGNPQPTAIQEPKSKPQLQKKTKIDDNQEISNTNKKEALPKPNKNLSSHFSLEIWNKVLVEIKKHNNPLYAILRMAKMDIDGGSVSLGFKFPFHQQRVSEQKNMTLIRQAIASHTSDEVYIETTIIEDDNPSQPEQLDDVITETSNPGVNAIIDIMGGGEVLENV